MRTPDADDLSHVIQQPEESARQFWTRFLTKKNQIVDCPEAMISTPSNTSHSSLKDQLGIDLTACQQGLEAAFLDNFQGTYVRPPDADDLSHVIQQP